MGWWCHNLILLYKTDEGEFSCWSREALASPVFNLWGVLIRDTLHLQVFASIPVMHLTVYIYSCYSLPYKSSLIFSLTQGTFRKLLSYFQMFLVLCFCLQCIKSMFMFCITLILFTVLVDRKCFV